MVTGLIAAMVLVLANGFFVVAQSALARIRWTHDYFAAGSAISVTVALADAARARTA